MAIEITTSSALEDSPLTGVGVFDDLSAVDPSLPMPDSVVLQRRGFEGKADQVATFDIADRTVVLVGLGSKAKLTLNGLRRAAAQFVRAASKAPSASLGLTAMVPPGETATRVAQAVSEGLRLGSYRFGEFKTKEDDRKLSSVSLIGADGTGVERGIAIADAVCLSRDLINRPPSAMTPIGLADVATVVAGEAGLQIRIWDEQQIEAEGMGGLRGVSMGSSQPPRMVELTYDPDGATETLAIVGKGITFDSGGLSLKPPAGMMTMKTDMSGAANVIATMKAVAALKPSVRVIGIFAATENLPGPSATKPGDVLRARNGKTMEVLNTDAEGRLVLADALSIAVEREPDAIVDMATLTGACIVALGNDIAGLMGNNETWSNQVAAAGRNAGEEFWPLPLPDRYRKHIDSEIADIKNIGASGGAAGTLTAGLFLKEFVGEVPWVHLDIAGPSRAESDDAYVTRGASGFGVRTMIELIENFRKPVA